MPLQRATLSNGIRVLVEPVTHVGSASIGLWCHTGSVNETDTEAGVTHLIEHMLFKGTARRSAKQIAEAIEGRGGMLNAFTDKEQTCYYCRVLASDTTAALDVLCDMVTGSLIDSEELEREKGVVLEEIKRGEDEPGDHVHDLHLQALWEGDRLGLPVIGTRESVSSFQREHLTAYIGRRYRTDSVLVSVAGNVEPEAVTAALEPLLGSISDKTPSADTTKPQARAGQNLVAKDVEQVHFCIGGPGVSVYSDDLFPAILLDGVLGSGMSSRLFQEVRERRGLVYAIGSYNLTYRTGGAYTVYGGTGMATWNQVQEVVRAEFDKLMKDGVPQDELDRVKRSLSGTLALSLEGMSSRMIRMAKNELSFGREIPLEETLAKIEAVTAGQLVELARRTLAEEHVRTTAIGPF